MYLSLSDPLMERQWPLSFSSKMVESRSILPICFLPSLGTALTHNTDRNLLNILGVKKLKKQRGRFLERLFHWRAQTELHLLGNLKILLSSLFCSCPASALLSILSLSGPWKCVIVFFSPFLLNESTIGTCRCLKTAFPR